MAYRGSQPFDEPRREAEGDLVSEMVRQFADPYAFLRELVQNAIDAGATRIEVAIEQDEGGLVRTSVTDDGCGMTRAIIEGPLLTLFSSSKESDGTKIGKYGVGFVSVFGVSPVRVEVRTARDGEAWLVRLFPDHAFELEKEPSRPTSGTTVSLVQRLGDAGFEAHRDRCHAALVRWCRFAHVPIVLRDPYAPEPSRTINRPLAVEALVSVTHEDAARGERLVVGAGGPGLVAAGYYNRGLTLLESHEPGDAAQWLVGVRFAVDSPKLAHTLSRDNVKRDGEYRRLLDLVRSIAGEKLRPLLAHRIVQAAREGDSAYVALVEASRAPVLEGIELEVPLVDRVDGRATLPAREVRRRSRGLVLHAEASSALTRAVARQARPVVHGAAVAAAARHQLDDVAPADGELAIATPAEPHAKDDELGQALLAALAAAERPAARVLFAAFEGAASGAPFRALPRDRAEPLATAKEIARLGWKKTDILYLDVAHAVVRLARRSALANPRLAGHLLARVLLLGQGPLPARVVDALLEHAAKGGDA